MISQSFDMNILARNLMILASAGSGKTYQLGNRVIGLIARQGVDPRRIVALTFTRKAAGEFTDSILSKVAEAVIEVEKHRELEDALEGPVDPEHVLQQIVEALPEMQLTTLDAFSSLIVRTFQYDLGIRGGGLDILQGEQKKVAEGEILDRLLLSSNIDHDSAFYRSFRESAVGKGGQGVRKSLEDFVEKWLQVYQSGFRKEMLAGFESRQLPKPGAWYAGWRGYLKRCEDASVPEEVVKTLQSFKDHVVGKSPKQSAVLDRVLENIEHRGPIEIPFRTGKIALDGPQWELVREFFLFLGACELSAKVQRTNAIWAMVGELDEAYDRTLRQRGRLTFSDMTDLLAHSAVDEDARLTREQIDYRLDGRYDHWLLDEFQDTSAKQLQSLQNLLNEAVLGEDGGLFVVGDRKQGIYGWRGGDSRLFDQLQGQYPPGSIETEPMDRSFRSVPAVLALVNQVCGDKKMIGSLFGQETAENWRWTDHEPAPSNAEKTGESRVTEVPKDDMEQTVLDLLEELKVDEKAFSCGVLVRTKEEITKWTELLRAYGHEVLEAGVRKPTEDHPVGIAIYQLISWLADPNNGFARRTVEMSPLGPLLVDRFGEEPGKQWSGLIRLFQREGYARGLRQLVAPLWEAMPRYARRRVEDLVDAFSSFDDLQKTCPRAAQAWIRGLEVSQAPGEAAIQVMTFHKSKGLGFDTVIIPGLSDFKVPNNGKFELAKAPGAKPEWVLEATSSAISKVIPEMAGALDRWTVAQRDEAMCLLYVALTRAKRGLYVIIPERAKGRLSGKEPDLTASPAHLVRETAGGDWQSGTAGWTEELSDRFGYEEEEVAPFGPGIVKELPVTPSEKALSKSSSANTGELTPGEAAQSGTDFHDELEQIQWLAADDDLSSFSPELRKVLEKGALRELLTEKPGVTVLREQPFDVRLEDGTWLSGQIDRLHVSDEIVEIYDYKFSPQATGEELGQQHEKQLLAYQKALALIYPGRVVKSSIVAVFQNEVVEV